MINQNMQPSAALFFQYSQHQCTAVIKAAVELEVSQAAETKPLRAYTFAEHFSLAPAKPRDGPAFNWRGQPKLAVSLIVAACF